MDFGSLDGLISEPLGQLGAGSADAAPSLDFGSAAIDNAPTFPGRLIGTFAGFLGSLGI
ncbi:hypothetical protein [Dietzia timorensis]|uniref:Uncharacterized protein n=1 Tax=Dietzia timorensis TaxID=499555 RepID=A0A173LGP4_9ACTN|nr:hypothetical protein [Dietzia timorensis]ANI90959.1 Hypothetical protein BJL86_0148 [Dietzia timorensis]